MSALSNRGKFISIYEIIAGVVGVLMAALAVFKPAPSGHAVGYYVNGALLILASVVSFLAGIKLLKGDASGIKLSCAIQTIQIPALILKGFHFQLFLLAGASLGIDNAKQFMLNYFAGARLFLAVGNVEFLFIGINILPLCILLLLQGAFKEKS